MQGFYTFKFYVLLLYGAFGLTCLVRAGAGSKEGVLGVRRGVDGQIFGIVAIALLAALLLSVYVLLGSVLLVDAAVIAAIIFAVSTGLRASPKTITAGVSTGIVVLSLVWWQMKPASGALLPLTAFAMVLGACSFTFSDPGRRSERFIAVPIVIFAIAGVALMGDLGSFRSSQLALLTLAHHWGAFIGPVLHLKAGLVPFYDVPLQYGLGPTLAIAMTCDGNECWRGAQAVFTLASLANSLLVLAMALASTVRRGWAWQCGVTAVIFCAVFLWAGFPSDGNMFLATPSVTGIRFLPLTLVACLLFFGHPKSATVAMVLAVLWSPESAAMSAVVFGTATTARVGFVKAAALTAALLLVSYCALFLVHRLVYGLWIDPLALVEYVLHVPGPLPIDPLSDILLLMTTLALGGWLILRGAPDPVGLRRDLVVTMLLFAATSYCLGRSHPNNICVLAPYLVLVAMRALERRDSAFETVRKATAFGLSVSVAALAFSPWDTKPLTMPPVVDIHDIVAGFSSLQPDLEHLRMEIPGGLGIADLGRAKIRNAAESVWWTPLDPSSLWIYVPSDRRRIYIERSAVRLRRSGWAIIVSRQLGLMNDLESAYTVSNRREVDGGIVEAGTPVLHYTIACFTPKVALVPTPVGPSCPPPEQKRPEVGEAKR